MNEVGVFKDNDYMDDKDHEIKWLEQSYATAQAQIARLEKSLVIKTDEIEVLKETNKRRTDEIVVLRDANIGQSHRLKEIYNHWLYKFHKSVTNLHKLRLHIKE